MSERVEFRLEMPGVGSWNGRWSGEGRNYIIKKNLTQKYIKKLGLDAGPQSWMHRWNDGWAASVTARILKKGERSKKSDGFCGYDWMVNNILWYGRTEACTTDDPHQWVSDRPGWERCKKYGCATSRKVPAESPAEAKP